MRFRVALLPALLVPLVAGCGGSSDSGSLQPLYATRVFSQETANRLIRAQFASDSEGTLSLLVDTLTMPEQGNVSDLNLANCSAPVLAQTGNRYNASGSCIWDDGVTRTFDVNIDTDSGGTLSGVLNTPDGPVNVAGSAPEKPTGYRVPESLSDVYTGTLKDGDLLMGTLAPITISRLGLVGGRIVIPQDEVQATILGSMQTTSENPALMTMRLIDANGAVRTATGSLDTATSILTFQSGQDEPLTAELVRGGL